jgi:hypothetical protein
MVGIKIKAMEDRLHCNVSSPILPQLNSKLPAKNVAQGTKLICSNIDVQVIQKQVSVKTSWTDLSPRLPEYRTNDLTTLPQKYLNC